MRPSGVCELDSNPAVRAQQGIETGEVSCVFNQMERRRVSGTTTPLEENGYHLKALYKRRTSVSAGERKSTKFRGEMIPLAERRTSRISFSRSRSIQRSFLPSNQQSFPQGFQW